VNFSEGATEADLYGFRHVDASGTSYVVPKLSFADLYENGGVWLGDEYDRANPNVIVSLNGALANGHLSLPKRHDKTQAVKHAEFGAVVTMNTWGTGPSAAYTSANKLDASSLDRFRIGTIYVDYDKKLEAHLMPDAVLLQKIWKVREQVMQLGLQRVVSTRFVKDAADCQQSLGWGHDKVMHKLVQDWSPADRQKVGLVQVQ
jgi:MoxR-like ATPase